MLRARIRRPELLLSLSLPPSALEGVEMFADLSADERARLGAELKAVNLQRGDVLMAQDAPADAMFVVVSGRFGVTVAGRATPVAELGPGQPVGRSPSSPGAHARQR